MKVIGLTGGIGSGKSTVSKFLADMGARVIDADRVGHEAFEPDTDAYREVVETFGREILTPAGEIDRHKLGSIVFADTKARDKLNRIMHPRIHSIVRDLIEEYRRRSVKIVVIDAPLLIEAKWTNLVDEVWVTVAPRHTVLERLTKRTGLTKAESLARIRSQLSHDERIKHADVVIDTNCALDELKAKVQELGQKLEAKDR